MTNKEINAIKNEIKLALICIPEDADINDFEEMTNKKLGVTMKQVDDWIDDGIDDEDSADEYVMGVSFDFAYKGINWHLRVFYGNNTGEVGCFDVKED